MLLLQYDRTIKKLRVKINYLFSLFSIVIHSFRLTQTNVDVIHDVSMIFVDIEVILNVRTNNIAQ